MSAALRVLHVATGNLYGGVEVFLHSLARQGGSAGMASEFSVCWSRGRLADELRATGAPVHDLGEVRLSRPWQVWRARHRLARVVQERRFDVAVLHSAWTHALLGPVLRRAGMPLVMGVHTLIPRRSRLERWARWTPLEGVFANSRFTADSARNWYPGHPEAELFYLPIEAPPPVSDAERMALRQSLGVGSDDCVILQASRMQSLKGQRTLLAALARLKTQPGWQCWLAGGAQRPTEQAYLEELEAFAKAEGLLNRVRFLGQRGDIPSLLAAADIVCQVNEEPEAFGLVYVEAMAAGKPVIAANRGGVAEVLDACSGALLPAGSVGPLVATLEQWITDPLLRLQLGAAGRARAAAQCDLPTQLRVFQALLARMAAPKKIRAEV